MGHVVCWHQNLHHVLTAVAVGEPLCDALEQTRPRVPRYRPPLLSDGEGAWGERTPCCGRPRGRCQREQRLRYATHPAVAFARVLLASLRRLQAAPRLAARRNDG